jgi:hypothetical protein
MTLMATAFQPDGESKEYKANQRNTRRGMESGAGMNGVDMTRKGIPRN